jgi:hypothetical protein
MHATHPISFASSNEEMVYYKATSAGDVAHVWMGPVHPLLAYTIHDSKVYKECTAAREIRLKRKSIEVYDQHVFEISFKSARLSFS